MPFLNCRRKKAIKKQPNMRHMESRAVFGKDGLIMLTMTVVFPVALSYMTFSSTLGCQGFSTDEFR